VNDVVAAHISDVHFGGRADLPQLAVLERFLPSLGPQVVVLSGDLTQRARHGEFQAAQRFLTGLGSFAPVHFVPGNHDVQWWRSPFGVAGPRPKYRKWRHYFGEDLTPTLELDDVIVAGMCSAHGLALGSLTLNPNDLTVKGHLPAREVARARAIFAAAPTHKVRLAVLHHNVLPGVVSARWGLARPRTAQAMLLTLGADVILCGHDHTEGAGLIGSRLAVSTAGTHSVRTRGGRPAAFNLIRVGDHRIQIEHYLYAPAEHAFRRGDTVLLPRSRGAAGAVGA
jgi:3',5'-cyclic AMP phosphodiesterase CpdA